jgi:hypothetical protein
VLKVKTVYVDIQAHRALKAPKEKQVLRALKAPKEKQAHRALKAQLAEMDYVAKLVPEV